MDYSLFWNRGKRLKPTERLFIPDSADGRRIEAGDNVYVVSNGLDCRILARLRVQGVHQDSYRRRVGITVGGPSSAYFFTRPQDAPPIPLLEEDENHNHKEAYALEPRSSQILATACGVHDFALVSLPVRWNAITRRVQIGISRSIRDGDSRPRVEIAEEFLRRNYVTSQLPGPTPVYQNAARRILGFDLPVGLPTHRERHILTDDAVIRGVNEDVAMAHHAPNSTRHQEILRQLMTQLKHMGFVPKYDGLVDCIVETEGVDLYFEVKSTTQESVAHQVRTGLGQVLHYMWTDAESSSRVIHGHLVVEGPWRPQDESLRAFVSSHAIGLTWSSQLSSLAVGDLDLMD